MLEPSNARFGHDLAAREQDRLMPVLGRPSHPFSRVLRPQPRLPPRIGVPKPRSLGTSLETPVLLIVLFPPWMLQRFVVGFSREEHATVSRTESLNEELIFSIVGSRGRVISPLRPMGTVEIDGREWTARTNDTQYIPVGTMVEVVDERGLVLLVIVNVDLAPVA